MWGKAGAFEKSMRGDFAGTGAGSDCGQTAGAERAMPRRETVASNLENCVLATMLTPRQALVATLSFCRFHLGFL
jgi:hypothetical protein